MIEEIFKHYNKVDYQNDNLSCVDLTDEIITLKGKILDIGCGTLQKGYEKLSGLEIHAVDINKNAIEQAKIKAIEMYPDLKIHFKRGYMENLPYSNNSFDGVFTNCAINHSLDKQKVFNEIYRVLKNGGNLIIADAFSEEELPEHIRSDCSLVAGCFGGAEPIENYLYYLKTADFNKISCRINKKYIKNGFNFLSATIFAFK